MSPRKTSEIKKEKVKREKNTCQIEVVDTEGKVVETLILPEKIFAAKVNEKLMAQAARVFLANQRQGTLKTKSRGEVQASTKKIYRQKGTGRARHGAISAPIFVGGGVAHGPKPRDFSLKMPKKMRRAALFGALTSKLAQKAIWVVKGLEEVKPKTKEMVKIFKSVKITGEDKKKKREKILVVSPHKIENLERAARNIEGVTLIPANLLNTYTVLGSERLLFLPESLTVLEENFLKDEKEVATVGKERGEIKNGDK